MRGLAKADAIVVRFLEDRKAIGTGAMTLVAGFGSGVDDRQIVLGMLEVFARNLTIFGQKLLLADALGARCGNQIHQQAIARPLAEGILFMPRDGRLGTLDGFLIALLTPFGLRRDDFPFGLCGSRLVCGQDGLDARDGLPHLLGSRPADGARTAEDFPKARQAGGLGFKGFLDGICVDFDGLGHCMPPYVERHIT